MAPAAAQRKRISSPVLLMPAMGGDPYEADGCRFYAEAGDVVCIPGGVEHGFVNVSDTPARQYILMTPALDAATFFTELGGVMHDGIPDTKALNVFGVKWQVEFLGPPVSRNDKPTE